MALRTVCRWMPGGRLRRLVVIGRLRSVVLFAGAVGCGYLVLSLALPPRAPQAPSADEQETRLLLERLAEGVSLRPGRWRSIVVHHSATASGNAERFHEYHLYELGWEGGLGYHFVIGNGRGSGDGEIEVGWRWPAQRDGIHVRSHNAGAIGICLVGNFEDDAPTSAQMAALVRLTRCLMSRLGVAPAAVSLHGELVATACPGRHFPTEAFRAAIAAPGPPERGPGAGASG